MTVSEADDRARIKQARARKAARMAHTAAALHVDADRLERCDDDGWRSLATLARVRMPSPESKSLTVARLRAIYAARVAVS